MYISLEKLYVGIFCIVQVHDCLVRQSIVPAKDSPLATLSLFADYIATIQTD